MFSISFTSLSEEITNVPVVYFSSGLFDTISVRPSNLISWIFLKTLLKLGFNAWDLAFAFKWGFCSSELNFCILKHFFVYVYSKPRQSLHFLLDWDEIWSEHPRDPKDTQHHLVILVVVAEWLLFANQLQWIIILNQMKSNEI